MHHLIHSRFVWNWKKGEKKRTQCLCVSPKWHKQLFYFISLIVITLQKSPPVPRRENYRTKREEVDMLYGIVPGKSSWYARLAISNIWNEQHIAVSVISPNIGSAWVNYWLNFRTNNICLSIHAIHSHFSPSCNSQLFFDFKWIACAYTGTNDHAMHRNIT